MTMLGNAHRTAGKLCVAAAFLAISAPIQVASAGEWPFFKESLRTFPTIDIAARQSKGQDAIDRLGLHLPDVAAWYGRTADQLRKELLNDSRMRIDKTGRVLFVEELEAPIPTEQVDTATVQQSIQQGSLVSLDQTFYLHSHPGATRTIYLDFNGASIVGTEPPRDCRRLVGLSYAAMGILSMAAVAA